MGQTLPTPAPFLPGGRPTACNALRRRVEHPVQVMRQTAAAKAPVGRWWSGQGATVLALMELDRIEGCGSFRVIW